MPARLENVVFDKGLEYVKTNCDKAILCKGDPANYAGIAAINAGEVAMAAVDLVIGDKVGGGREITTAAKSGTLTASSTGEDLFVALVNSVGSELLVVVDEVTNMHLNSGQSFSLPAMTFGISNPP